MRRRGTEIICIRVCLLMGMAALVPGGCKNGQARIEEAHYCRDAAGWAEWDQLLAKYPTDEDIITLYALRSGLCGMIVKGRVETRTAIRIFDRAHAIVVGKTIDREAAETRREEM